jgi:hypothetical protein
MVIASLLVLAMAPTGVPLPSLPAVKACIARVVRAEAVASCGPVTTPGFEFFREADLGAGRRILALTGRWSSGVFLFDDAGKALAFEPIGELAWLTLVDLDHDGEAEVLLDETLGRGTGVLSRGFAVLQASATALRRVWSARSYYHTERANDRGELVESLTEEGRVRLDLSNRLLYTLSRNGTKVQDVVLEMKNGALTPAK